MELVYPNEPRLFRIALVLSLLIWAALIVGTLGIALLYIGFFALFAMFAQSGFITYLKGNGVRITEDQYPELHSALLESCEQLGINEIPDTYLLRTDFFNALATRFLRRHYVVLFTDVVDSLQDQPDAVKFYIGHELGHIQRNHIRSGWLLAPVLWLPVLGNAYRRAEEYTCDRYGNACCNNEGDAVAALAAIVAGDTKWKTMNTEAYLEQVNGTGGFFMSLNEFISDYPWLCKRLAWILALRNGKSQPQFPPRSKFAGLLSLFVPRMPGGFFSLILIVSVAAVLAAVALPAYQNYVATAKQAELMQQAQLVQQAMATASSQETVASPSVSPLVTPTNVTAMLQEVAPIREEVQAYFTAQGTLPSDLTQLGYDVSAVYLSSARLPFAVYEDGILAVTAGATDDDSAYLIVEPVASGSGQLEWYCYGQNLTKEHLPEVCLSDAPLPAP